MLAAISTDPWVWVAAFFTLAVFSFLYKDNPLYRFAEHVMVGVAGGYILVLQWYTVAKPDLINPLLDGKFLVLIPGALCIFMLLRVWKKAEHLSRMAIAFMVGIGAGAQIPGLTQARILTQIKGSASVRFYTPDPKKCVVKAGKKVCATGLTCNKNNHCVKPCAKAGQCGAKAVCRDGGCYAKGKSWHQIIGQVVMLAATICGLIYFYFSKAHTGVFGVAAKFGIWMLMIGFGASFGYTVMARISLFIGRVQFLLKDWLGLIQ